MALEFDLNPSAPASLATDAVVVGVFADGTLTPAGAELDAASGGRLAALQARGDLPGKAGRVSLLTDLPGVTAPRVLVVGLGEAAKFNAAAYQKAVGEAVRALKNTPAKHALLTLAELAIDGRDAGFAIEQAVVCADHAGYRYTATRKASNGADLARLSIRGEDAAALERGRAIAAGVELARELGHLPPNICNPAYLADTARRIAAENEGVQVEVLEEPELEKLGMGSLLAVGRGSHNRPKVIVLKWNGGGEAKPHVLVGKGITFDTGGINLKVQGGIEEMKFDMLGAASVLGSFLTAAKLKLPINLVAIAAAVENMPDGNAYRPSDVLTSMSGKTIEVGNTDAEGRLILCDALTYAQRFEPKALIDVATLTGAIIIALGKHATGLMSHHDDLAAELLAAGEYAHDRAWRMPVWEDYQSQLDSIYADVYNIGGKAAGSITAACFLARFTEGQRWAHLDIAGSSSDEGRKGMATGRPVGLLTRWLIDQAARP
ncbi:MAG: leucyl aminopeptidase [Xanthomonadaceae bacterium]|nr:leucyl aminopeptidase [Xanthomonadaceae bacterium]